MTEALTEVEALLGWLVRRETGQELEMFLPS